MRNRPVGREVLLSAIRRRVLARPQEPDEEPAATPGPSSGPRTQDGLILDVALPWSDGEILDSVLAALLPQGRGKLVMARGTQQASRARARARAKKAP